MSVVPAATPRASPVEEPIVATEVVPLVHVPPPGVELNVLVLPIHTAIVPVIAVGNGFTVTTAIEDTVPQANVTV